MFLQQVLNYLVQHFSLATHFREGVKYGYFTVRLTVSVWIGFDPYVLRFCIKFGKYKY